MDQVPIDSVRPHPDNPRRGNIQMIADSLATNGQYKPILVHERTGHILAGTHTWKAARQLGWTTIAAVFKDCDAAEARAIMLADNRAADAGWTDEESAFAILATLPSLNGTGYTIDDLHLPPLNVDEEWDVAGDGEPQERREPPEMDETPETPATRFEIGAARGLIDPDEYARWRDTLPKSSSMAAQEVLTRLGLGHKPAPQRPGERVTELVPITSLEEYPGNPRQGDIGLLGTLLKHHGQYRPITASIRTRRVLAGNHVMAAAKQLGWQNIWVAWADVDEDGEKRILLADNRTSDLAAYDNDKLGRALAAAGPAMIEQTGFTLSDLEDVLAGRPIRETPRTGGAWIKIGKITAKTTHHALAGLCLTQGSELSEAAFMLGIDPGKVAQGPPAQKP